MTRYTKEQAIQSTQEHVFSWAALQELQNEHGLTYQEWRCVGNYQKDLYLQGLLARAGQCDGQHFVFNNADWHNLFQLEAIVEFYANFPDPWLKGSIPRQQEDQHYQRVDFLPSGQVEVRPILVVVDGFGGRIAGVNAVSGAQTNTVRLDSQKHLFAEAGVNPKTDTIYFPSDQGRLSKSYRILAIDDTLNEVTLDSTPVFAQGSSSWHIPAGIGGKLPALEYDLGPGNVPEYRQCGFDHYDGALFVVYDGQIVQNPFRWTSYTSRHNHGQLSSSIRGNQRYEFRSLRAGTKEMINYAFWVVNPPPVAPKVAVDARFYFGYPCDFQNICVFDDDGKTGIFIHYGYDQGIETGSSGCLVSPSFYRLRDLLVQIYLNEFTPTESDSKSGKTDILNRLLGLNHEASMHFYEQTDSDWAKDHWNHNIVGDLWVIRPDERPLGA